MTLAHLRRLLPSTRAVARKATPGTVRAGRRADGTQEQQAERAADHSVRHLTNVSRQLTEAPAAAYELPSSPARELPTPVRADLEQTFGANLAAVRVHDDGAAHAASYREEAEAFTAGRHIYFAQGRYAPGTTEGWRLLSHEIAHVLQQTGRRHSTTLIEATERAGTGDIQRQAAMPLFAAIVRHYAAELSRLRPAQAAPAAGPPQEDVDG